MKDDLGVRLAAGVLAVGIAAGTLGGIGDIAWLGLPAVCPAAAWAEEPPAKPTKEAKDKALRDARALIRSGNFDAGIHELERIYAIFPDDPVVISTLTSALIGARRYDGAEAVLKKSVERRPKDPKSLSDLASLYLTMGRKADGLAAINGLIELAPEEPWAYQMASSLLLQSGAADAAIEVVARARKATDDPMLLALDAARAYRTLARYDEAAGEYLLAGEAEHDPGIAVEGIVEMAESLDARPVVTAKLAAVAAGRAAGGASTDLAGEIARGALWQIYLGDGDCDRAFGELSALAAMAKLTPDMVAGFAAKSRERGCHRQCAEVFGLALGLPQNKADLPRLMLNKAECELASGQTDEAIATYRGMAREYPDSKWGFEAQVALGRMLRDLGRLDEAIAGADEVMSSEHAGDARYDAVIFKGDCLVRAGRLDEAFTTYDLVGTDWKATYAQEAFYNLGEIKFYQGSFDDAVSYYNVTLREYPDEPRANDAVGRLLLIKGVKGDLGLMWLKEYAQGALLRRQGMVDEAAALFAKRAGEQGQGLVKVESLRGLAAIAADSGDLESAIKLYKLVGETLDTYCSPSALEAAGDAYLKMGKAPEAIRVYEDVILKYPQSVAAGEARRKIDAAKREAKSGPSGRTGALE